MSQDSWIETQEKISLFKGGDVSGLAKELLKIGNTNRIVLPEQAKLLMCLRMIGKRLEDSDKKWDWLNKLADMCEEYQLTVGMPKNSRQAFVEALKAELGYQEKEKSKGMSLV